MYDFLYNNLNSHWRVLRMHSKARSFIRELFEAYVNTPVILPDNVQLHIQQKSLHRTVCDHIAGMTDRYALKEHDKLFNPMSQV